MTTQNKYHVTLVYWRPETDSTVRVPWGTTDNPFARDRWEDNQQPPSQDFVYSGADLQEMPVPFWRKICGWPTTDRAFAIFMMLGLIVQVLALLSVALWGVVP